MRRTLEGIGIILLVLVLLPGLGGVAGAAFPIKITGYVGLNNTPGAPMVTPLAGWTVTLKKAPYTSTAATTTTSSTGAYTLSVTSIMGAGTYRVYETVRTGYKNYTVTYAQFTISSSSSAQKANFTNYQVPSVILFGHKYQDPDGKHASAATPLAGWTIQLNRLSGSTWSTMATVATNNTGAYQFQVTDVGSYRVIEVEQAGYEKTWPAGYYSQTIRGGQTGIITQDFWNQKLMNAKVSGHVYEDPDLTHTSMATPLAGWKIHLQILSGTTWAEVASTTTATGTGYYEFTSIGIPGSYRVVVDQQAGYLAGSPLDGIASFGLDVNSPARTADFWSYRVPDVVISGHSFLDPDGTHASRTHPLGGSTVRLQKQSGTIWSEVAAVTATPATGAYELPVIKTPGSYRVSMDAPDGYAPTFPLGYYTYMIGCGQVTPSPDQDFWNRKVVGVPDPDPVPVPEFPGIAVSILTVSGMFIAVQFMKKRD